MADMNYDPYAGADTEEERQAIYQKLLIQYEQSEYERRKAVYTDLMSSWKYQRDHQKDIDQRTHKSLLALASGSFGVSFAFISQVVKLDSATNIPALILSWGLFAFTIILAVLELKIGSIIQGKLLDNTEKNIERGYEGKPYIEPNRRHIMWPGRIMGWVSFIAFTVGVACLIYFVLQNV